ncbi:hypothetical protein FVP46_03970, partial [Mycobacterium tuberculosis]|nr:hypothetical protein [Mycobacterium tuberculosis]
PSSARCPNTTRVRAMPGRAVDPDASLTGVGRTRRVAHLLEEIDPAERAGVRPTDLALDFRAEPAGD